MASDGREGGYIKLYRRIESWPLWQSMTARQRMVWIQLLLSVNWRDGEGWYGKRRYPVKRGQTSLSESEIAKKAKVDRQVVRDAYAKFDAEGAIARERVRFESGSGPDETDHQKNQAPYLTTIVNFDRFQGSDDNENPAENQARTKREPSENQARTPIEEGKKVRREEETLRLAPQAASLPRVKPDPDYRPLADALVAAFLAARGGKYGFDRTRDPDALKRLLGWSRDIPDHARRFRAALNAPAGDYSFRVDTIAAFATGRVWNHFAPVGQRSADGPAMLAPLGQR